MIGNGKRRERGRGGRRRRRGRIEKRRRCRLRMSGRRRKGGRRSRGRAFVRRGGGSSRGRSRWWNDVNTSNLRLKHLLWSVIAIHGAFVGLLPIGEGLCHAIIPPRVGPILYVCSHRLLVGLLRGARHLLGASHGEERNGVGGERQTGGCDDEVRRGKSKEERRNGGWIEPGLERGLARVTIRKYNHQHTTTTNTAKYV